MPEGTTPKRILSRKRLLSTWHASRDATSNPASPGLDGWTVAAFARNIDKNITLLHQELISGRFHFSKLKAALIPKADGRFRVIAIPTVRDRLVQRAIASWLVKSERFTHQDFVYGIKGDGVRQATSRALTIRRSHEWCVKTDIHSFFDNINREKLKTRISSRLRSSSIRPLLFNAIDSEIKARTTDQRKQIEAEGIRLGFGIRQGMPLSPLLANISLASFDAKCKKKGISLLRYADDVIAFFQDKPQALEGLQTMKDALAELELEIPELGSAKTDLVAPQQSVTFLGRELIYLAREKDYVWKVSDKKLIAIKESLIKQYSLNTVIHNDKTMADAVKSLALSISSYLGAYKEAYNFNHLNNELRNCFRSISGRWFIEIFGGEIMKRISEPHRLFLGIQSTKDIVPTTDSEIAY